MNVRERSADVTMVLLAWSCAALLGLVACNNNPSNPDAIYNEADLIDANQIVQEAIDQYRQRIAPYYTAGKVSAEEVAAMERLIPEAHAADLRLGASKAVTCEVPQGLAHWIPWLTTLQIAYANNAVTSERGSNCDEEAEFGVNWRWNRRVADGAEPLPNGDFPWTLCGGFASAAPPCVSNPCQGCVPFLFWLGKASELLATYGTSDFVVANRWTSEISGVDREFWGVWYENTDRELDSVVVLNDDGFGQ